MAHIVPVDLISFSLVQLYNEIWDWYLGLSGHWFDILLLHVHGTQPVIGIRYLVFFLIEWTSSIWATKQCHGALDQQLPSSCIKCYFERCR